MSEQLKEACKHCKRCLDGCELCRHCGVCKHCGQGGQDKQPPVKSQTLEEALRKLAEDQKKQRPFLPKGPTFYY